MIPEMYTLKLSSLTDGPSSLFSFGLAVKTTILMQLYVYREITHFEGGLHILKCDISVQR